MSTVAHVVARSSTSTTATPHVPGCEKLSNGHTAVSGREAQSESNALSRRGSLTGAGPIEHGWQATLRSAAPFKFLAGPGGS